MFKPKGLLSEVSRFYKIPSVFAAFIISAAQIVLNLPFSLPPAFFTACLGRHLSEVMSWQSNIPERRANSNQAISMRKRTNKLRPAILTALLGLFADASAQQSLVLPHGDTVCGLNLVNPRHQGINFTLANSPQKIGTTWRFTPNQVLALNPTLKYTIEFTTGEWARVIMVNGNTAVTGRVFSPGNPALIPANTPFIIRQVMTVADVFGAIPPLLPGTTPTTADSIEMPNGDSYFYNGTQWRRRLSNGSTVNNQSARPLWFVQGFIFHRKGAGTLNLTVPVGLGGVVKASPTWVDLGHVMVRGSVGNVGTAGALVSSITSTTRGTGPLSLVTSGLQDYVTHGFFGHAGADIMHIQNASGTLTYDQYYYDEDPVSWADLNDVPVNGALVNLPSGVFVSRANPSGTQYVQWNP